MTTAQAILVIGGLASLWYSTLAGFALYWERMRALDAEQPRYAQITHTSAITNGLVLLVLAYVITYSGLDDSVNVILAVFAVTAGLLSAVRNTWSWRASDVDGLADATPAQRRLRGIVNVLNFVVMSALLYGVTRFTLGM